MIMQLPQTKVVDADEIGLMNIQFLWTNKHVSLYMVKNSQFVYVGDCCSCLSLDATTLWTWDLVNYSWPIHAPSTLVDQNGNQIANLAPRLNSRHRCKDVTQEGQKAAKFQGFKKQVFVLAMSIRDTYVDEYAS